jgi:Family of unknown function (DUF6941)
MPEIEYVFLADAADARPGQKFAILGGGVSRIGGPSLPIRHPHLALVVGLRVAPGELGRDHDVAFQLVRPDGNELTSAAARIRAEGVPGADDTIMTFSVDLWNLVFETAGLHTVRISVNGAERKRLPLSIDLVVGEGPLQPPFPAPVGQA